MNNVYVIFYDEHSGYTLERIEEFRWSFVRDIVEKDSIVFVTPDIHDESLLSLLEEHKISEIVWNRYFNPMNKTRIKVRVNFTPDDIPSMEEAAQKQEKELYIQLQEQISEYKKKKEKQSQKYEEKLNQHQELVEENSKDFSDDMSDLEAILLWGEKKFIMPPPKTITKLKKFWNIKWNSLLESSKHIYRMFTDTEVNTKTLEEWIVPNKDNISVIRLYYNRKNIPVLFDDNTYEYFYLKDGKTVVHAEEYEKAGKFLLSHVPLKVYPLQYLEYNMLFNRNQFNCDYPVDKIILVALFGTDSIDDDHT